MRLLLLSALLAACAVEPGEPAGEAAGPRLPAAMADGRGRANVESPAAETEPVSVVVQQKGQDPGDYGPDILRPPAGAGDDVVAQVGDLELRKSHAFSRLVAADPELAVNAIDLLVFDVLVAEHAERHGITVDAEKVERLALEEEQKLLTRVKAELGEDADLAGYVGRIFGMQLADWRQTTRLRIAQRLYHGYVIRYLALLEDRVQIRYVVNRDRAVVEEVAEKVRQGADFATLALRHSEDSYRADGGLLPPISRDFPHPIADVAFSLGQGELSPVLEREIEGVERYYVVYCLRRLPGRNVPFEQVRDELDAELERRPLTPLETNAFSIRYRSALEARKSGEPGRAKEDGGR